MLADVSATNTFVLPEVYLGIFVVGFGVVLVGFLAWYIIMRRRDVD